MDKDMRDKINDSAYFIGIITKGIYDNPEKLEIFNYAKSLGKPMILIKDIKISWEELEEHLKGCNIIAKIERKKDNSHLYELDCILYKLSWIE